MPIEIKSTKDVRVNGVKLVVYGAPKIGKTRLCATAPNPIIISAEHGLLSLKNQDIPYIEVATLQDIQDAYSLLKENSKYDTICLDSVSEIAEIVYERTRIELEKQAKKDNKLFDGRKSYQKFADRMMPMMRRYRDIKGKNVVFTAKQKRYEDETTKRTNMEPMMPGQIVSNNLPYLVDEILYMDRAKTKEGEYVFLRCKPKIGFEIIGDRSGELNEQEPPDLTKLFAKIKGEKQPDLKVIKDK